MGSKKYSNNMAPGKSEHDEHSLEVVHTADIMHLADDVSYGSNGIRGLVASPYVLGAAFLASLGGFSFGYDQGVISIINVMPQFHAVFPQINSAFGKSFMTAMLQLGSFVGCLFFPYLADKISRKRALTVVVVIFNIGAIMQTSSRSYSTLVAGRAIGGIGVGTLALGAPLYISEIAPPNLRGALLVLESISIVSGVVIAFWVTYGTRYIPGEAAFRLPLGMQMISATILGIGIHFFPYSPRWLALVKRDEDCLQSLCKLRRLPSDDSRVQTEYRGILAEVEFQNALQERLHPGVSGFKLELLQWLDLFSSKLWRRVIVGVGVCFFQQFSGIKLKLARPICSNVMIDAKHMEAYGGYQNQLINAFIYYAPTLFAELGNDSERSLILSGIFNILQLVTVVVCFLIIDKVGRRPLAIFGAFGCAACYSVIAILSGLYENSWISHPAAGWACVAMAFLFILIFGATYSCLGWALPPEVFPTSVRSKGVALAVAVNWLSNFTIRVATPPMVQSIRYGAYIFFCAMLVLAGIWAVLFVPETMGKTLEQMDEAFGDHASSDDMAVMQHAVANVRRRFSAGAKPV